MNGYNPHYEPSLVDAKTGHLAFRAQMTRAQYKLLSRGLRAAKKMGDPYQATAWSLLTPQESAVFTHRPLPGGLIKFMAWANRRKRYCFSS